MSNEYLSNQKRNVFLTIEQVLRTKPNYFNKLLQCNNESDSHHKVLTDVRDWLYSIPKLCKFEVSDHRIRRKNL